MLVLPTLLVTWPEASKLLGPSQPWGRLYPPDVTVEPPEAMDQFRSRQGTPLRASELRGAGGAGGAGGQLLTVNGSFHSMGVVYGTEKQGCGRLWPVLNGAWTRPSTLALSSV